MKNTGICPKCNSTKIIRIPAQLNINGMADNAIYLPGFFFGKNVSVTRYFCEDCGFIEEWVDNIDERKKIVEKYKDKK